MAMFKSIIISTAVVALFVGATGEAEAKRKHGNGLWFIPAEIDDWMARLGTHAPAGPSATALLKKLRQAGKRKPRAA